MYHRITETQAADPWQLAVSPSNFSQQLGYLDSKWNIWRLDDLVSALHQGKMPRRAVAITFDDGYADNLHEAAPRLRSLGLPATFFITTGAIGDEGEFWWDDLERCILHSDSPFVDELWEVVPGMRTLTGHHEFDYAPPQAAIKPNNCSKIRWLTYGFLWRYAAKLSPEERDVLLNRLHELTHTPRVARPTHRTLKLEELNQLSNVDGLSIGAHTVTHTPLTSLEDPDHRRKEVRECRRWLQVNVGSGVLDMLSYPNGAHDEKIAAILEEEGFRAAFTTRRAAINAKSCTMSLPRVQVPDIRGKTFEKMISRHFNVD